MDKYYYVLSLVRIFSRLDAGILFTNIWIIPLKFSDGQLHFCFKGLAIQINIFHSNFYKSK